MADGLNPSDLDAMARTMVAEARSQDPMGWAAVGSVIRNRLQAGTYGASPAAIVQAPNQFEVWSNGRAQAIDPSSDAYQGAARVAQAVAAGLPDVTNGSTHFYSPSGQTALGRNAPKWGQGAPNAAIGGQLFYAPNGAVKQQAPAAEAIASVAPSEGDAVTEDPMATLKRYGVAPGGQPAPAAPSPPAGVVFAQPQTQQPAAEDPMATLARYGAKPSAGPSPAPAAAAPAPAAAPAADPASNGMRGGIHALAGGVISGLPIVGPSLLGGLERTAALYDTATKGGTFADNLLTQQRKDASDDAAHPIAKTVGQVGGGILGTAPMIAAAPEAFGISQAPVLLRAATAAGTSGVLGAADAGARGENMLLGAAAGGTAGAAGPIAGKALGSAVAGVGRLGTSGIDGIGSRAANILTQAMTADSTAPGAVEAAAARLGPSAILPDLGPSMNGLASGLAVKPGDAKSALFSVLENRAAGANARIGADLDATLGAPTDPQAVSNALKVQRGLQDDVNYGAAHSQGVAVDPSGAVAAIDAQLPTATGAARTALQNFRRELVVRDAQPATDTAAAQPAQYNTNSELLHNLRKEADLALGGQAPGLGVQPGALAGSERAIATVRNNLDQALKSQVPGMAEADAASAAMARQIEAVDRGTQILGSGKSTQTPESFAADFARMAPEEQDALRAGVRGEIARLVGTKANDPAALRTALQGDGGWNTAKLATVFGEGPTNDLVNAVGREGTFGKTVDRVIGNSQTAQRTAAAGLLKDADPAQVDLKSSTVQGWVAHAGNKFLYQPAKNYLLTPNNASRDAQLGQAFSMQGPARDNLLTQIAARAAGTNRANAAAAMGDSGATAATNLLLQPYLRRRTAN